MDRPTTKEVIDSLAVLEKAVSFYGHLVARADAIMTDCNIMKRNPTKEECYFINSVMFIFGDGTKPLGVLHNGVGDEQTKRITTA